MVTVSYENDTRVLITGTSRGIGRATAIKFLESGMTVFGIDIKPSTIPGDQYTKYFHIVTDISKTDSIPVISNIDILINNAGVQNTEDDIAVNLKGTIAVTELYLMPKKLKSIVMLASTSAHNGAEFPDQVASKGGILAYTKNVAKRCAMFGCTCNSISPGGVTTELNEPVMNDPKLWNDIMKITPLKKWASPEEVAEWIYFISVINKSVTGQDIIIDNGELNNAEFIWSVN